MNLYNSTEITVHKLNELRDEDKKIQILDVREDTERDHAHIKGTIHIKLSEIANRYTELDGDKNIFVMSIIGTPLLIAAITLLYFSINLSIY